MNFPNGFSDPGTSQQTINPLFLNTSDQSGNQQHVPINDNFLYLGPADFERPNNSKYVLSFCFALEFLKGNNAKLTFFPLGHSIITGTTYKRRHQTNMPSVTNLSHPNSQRWK